MKYLLEKRLRTLFFMSLSVFGILAIFLYFTNPFFISPLAVLVPFILFFIASFLLFCFLCRTFGQIFRYKLNNIKIFRLSFALSGLPTVFFLIQSISEVNVFDAILIVLVFFVADFYVARSARSSDFDD